MQRGSRKRPPMKKEAPKNTKGLTQKTSDKKRGTPKTQRGSHKIPPIKKEAFQKRKGAHTKYLR
jgi:hypothetical protein